MEKGEKSQKIKIGQPGYLNENCWLVRNLNYAPYKRCQYCELKFRKCLFFQYLTVSLILILFLFALSFFIEGKISKLVVISIFVFVIIYGYFFNRSTEKIIEANFAQRKAKEALEELTETLQQKVDEQTKELRKSYEELKVLDKAKSEFISIASHQLRTPLAAVKGYISMVLEGSYGKLNERAKRPMENVYQSNERLIKLVNDLLNLSRLDAGKIKFEPKPTSLEEMVKGIVEELRITIENKGLYIKMKWPELPLPEVMVDRDHIRQVIINIIDNAIRYTEKGGVTVKFQITNSKLQIIIADTGEGMTKEEISHLFESFSRGTAGTRFWTEGAGLGLYIARKFIDMHKGRIFAESKGKGKGSTFYIEIPTK